MDPPTQARDHPVRIAATIRVVVYAIYKKGFLSPRSNKEAAAGVPIDAKKGDALVDLAVVLDSPYRVQLLPGPSRLVVSPQQVGRTVGGPQHLKVHGQKWHP